MERFKTVINLIIVTSVIGLAISYITQLLVGIPDFNFLEAVGLYALYMPIHYALLNYFEENDYK